MTRADFPLKTFQLALPPLLSIFQQIRLQNALDKSLQQRRHVAAPKRKHKDDVVAGHEGVARGGDIRLERLLAPVAAVQDRIEIHLLQQK